MIERAEVAEVAERSQVGSDDLVIGSVPTGDR
jgi:hypothetical protein